MADSSFDPLALVKAMGPQADPTEWAKLYAQDASKGQQLREEIKNRLMLHESDQRSREREGAANRSSAEGIADKRGNVSLEVAKRRLEAFQANRAAAAKDLIYPPDSYPADLATAAQLGIGFAKTDLSKTHHLEQHGSAKVYVPNGQSVRRSGTTPEVAPPAAPVINPDGF
jgi:hypothetical protein